MGDINDMEINTLRERVRALVGDEPMCYDQDDETLEWSNEQVSIFCNDVFFWGAADSEDVTPDNLPLLEASVKDIESITGNNNDAGILFVARSRKMRPQGAMYGFIDERVHRLFNEAGPEREVGFGNPYPNDDSYAKAVAARTK